MNFGKYSLEDTEEDGTSRRRSSRGQRQAPSDGPEDPQRPERAATDRATQTASSSSMREARLAEEALHNRPFELPPYWSTNYSGRSIRGFLGARTGMYTGYSPWSSSAQIGAAASASLSFDLDQQPTSARLGFARRGVASHVNAPLKWTERGIQLRNRVHLDAIYSVKVFLGGLPQDTTAETIQKAFAGVQVVRVLKEPRDAHAYLVFASDAAVKNLLSECDAAADGTYFYQVVGRSAQVIPWATQDAEWGSETRLPGEKCNLTLFIGGLHGETTAEHLKIIMEEKFGKVRYVKIDTDKFNYPNGSGRVQFVARLSFLNALTANYLEINTKHYSRTVQIEPFFERFKSCSECQQIAGTSICRYSSCLNYFCRPCFARHQEKQGQSSFLHLPIGRH